MPTGCGKTVTFLSAAKALGKKTLILAHRNELIRQTIDKALKIGIDADKIGEFSFERKSVSNLITVGSIQTVIRHIPVIQEAQFECLIIDECHHAASSSYQDIINKLNFYDGTKYLLGFTATPIRGDHLSLADTFPVWSYNLTLEEAIRKQYISDIRGIWININADLKSMRSSRGDYGVTELANIMNSDNRNSVVAQAVQDYALDKKSIAFCVTVQHAQDLCAALNAYHPDIKAEVITGEMSMEQREKIYADFRENKVTVLCSCMVLTEGFDVPDVTCILMVRPTRSPLLYRQMIGRGLRKHPGKNECLVIEFTSNDKKMLTLEDISPERKIAKIKEGKSFKEAVEKEDKEKEEQSKVYSIEIEIYDPLNRNSTPVFVSEELGNGHFFIPHHFGFFYGYPLNNEHSTIEIIEFRKLPKSFTEVVDSDFTAQSYSEAIDMIQRNMKRRNIRMYYPLPDDPATEKQIKILHQFKVPYDGISKREASKRINRVFIVEYLNKRYKNNFARFSE